MATFKAIVKSRRADGYMKVYIRVTHNRDLAYISTGKMVSQRGLDRRGEIRDPTVLDWCTRKIADYNDLLNRQDTQLWTVREVVEYLQNDFRNISFSDYARKHINAMINAGQERNARNYKLALRSLELFVGTNRITFGRLTSHILDKWMKNLSSTRRAKEMYPICMRQVFKAALIELNDYETGMVRIPVNPWLKLRIPKSDRPDKIAITPEECREFFSCPLPESPMKEPLTEIARDVAMMVLCLAGINTVDLFSLEKRRCTGGTIRYNRSKTKKFRPDKAYMEMRVPPILEPLVEKYLSHDPDDPYMLDFHSRYRSSDSFSANVNCGIKKICSSLGIPKEEAYCVYTFRHTWATVAQNDVRADLEDIAFAMNHASAHRVTRGYIKPDFTRAWELNEKVIDFIFFSDKPSSRIAGNERESFKLSPRRMVNASAYHNGRKVAEIVDIGFSNIDQVIERLVPELPADIPVRSTVMFKITDMDKDITAVYHRQKGKGF